MNETELKKETAVSNKPVEAACAEKPSVIDPMDNTEKQPFTTTKKPDVSPLKKGVVANCGKLNLRNGPWLSAKILETIAKDSIVAVDMEKSTSDFYHVTTGRGVSGFCKKDYIKLI